MEGISLRQSWDYKVQNEMADFSTTKFWRCMTPTMGQLVLVENINTLVHTATGSWQVLAVGQGKKNVWHQPQDFLSGGLGWWFL